ncbi:lipase [Rhodococcus sp. D2-41]|uniref:lipase family protein n=1 Tax=Speluncibacter jeojiensis TaxID=2710754 RepID=UPI003852F950|nr:lipase [Rhodococcus sp. D2-41]
MPRIHGRPRAGGRSLRWRAVTACTALGIAVAGAVLPATTASAAPDATPGTVVSSTPLASNLWIPGTGQADRVTYWSTGPDGAPVQTTGAVYVPKGAPPAGGWPVLSWAHGTVGLAPDCAPSVAGPAARDRDMDYLGTWMSKGYAIVATDYAFVGNPGVMPYLDGKVEAHNVVDMVKAGRNLDSSLSNKWVVIGQSQGGGAAITTARYATEFGGPGLDYRGAVGTGVPAYIESIVATFAPGFPPVALPAGMTAYGMYILAGLNVSHPELNVPSYLNATGKQWLQKASTMCLEPFENEIKGTVLSSLLTKPLSSLNANGLLSSYMGVPESGYDKPFLIGQGLKDTDIVMPATLLFGTRLVANHQPVTFKTYPTDHSGTMAASLPDSVPFVQKLFAGQTPAPGFGSAGGSGSVSGSAGTASAGAVGTLLGSSGS